MATLEICLIKTKQKDSKSIMTVVFRSLENFLSAGK